MIRKSVLLFLPKSNFNEEEFLIVKNYLELKKILVFIASDAVNICTGSKGMKVKNDVLINNINPNNFAAIILIGGSGAREYKNNPKVHKIIQRFNEQKKLIAAICAAPLILGYSGILRNSEATCFPSDKEELIKLIKTFKDLSVVIDNNIITATDVTAAKDFAVLISNYLTKNFRN